MGNFLGHCKYVYAHVCGCEKIVHIIYNKFHCVTSQNIVILSSFLAIFLSCVYSSLAFRDKLFYRALLLPLISTYRYKTYYKIQNTANEVAFHVRIRLLCGWRTLSVKALHDAEPLSERVSSFLLK